MNLTIPLFPLKVTVLPDDIIPLHIFEDRYKKMIDSSIETNSQFGIILNSKSKFCKIGCLVSVDKILNKYDDGRYDLLIKGEKRFEIISTTIENNLQSAKIKILDENYNNSQKMISNIIDKYIKMLLIFNVKHDYQTEINKNNHVFMI